MNWKAASKRIWHFIWEEDSIWSWIANIVLAFVLIKFIVYPALGFMLHTTHPVVAVVSESMEHDGSFDQWWDSASQWYVGNSMTKEQFQDFAMTNGFDKGDIMILKGKEPAEIQMGDIIVFWSTKKDPIIHRVVKKWQDKDGYHFQTKGDNYKTNPASIKTIFLDETDISEEQVVGNAVARIPLLGYIKIFFVQLVDSGRMLLQKG